MASTHNSPDDGAPRGYVLQPEEGTPGYDASVKASGAATGGVLTLLESHTTGGAPRHVHTREDECMYVLDGTITVECGGEEFTAGPRSFVFLPRGVPHAWDVPNGEPVVVLIFTIPAMLEEFLREYHEAASEPKHLRDAVAEKYGITFL
jgi:mannose-6-phosphate isomerase-like protein (cupin superfamily)